MAATIDIEILEDGTLSIKTRDIKQSVHKSADEFLLDLEKTLGPKKLIDKKKHKHFAGHHILRKAKV